jgi:tetratricopeptide (TPR) repeat protein
LEYYGQALSLRRQVGNKGGEATTLNNIGKIYNELGEKDKALEYYEQALPLMMQVGDKSGEAVTCNNIGWIYYEQDQLEEAIPWVVRCIELMEQVQDFTIQVARETLTYWQAELAQKMQGENEG